MPLTQQVCASSGVFFVTRYPIGRCVPRINNISYASGLGSEFTIGPPVRINLMFTSQSFTLCFPARSVTQSAQSILPPSKQRPGVCRHVYFISIGVTFLSLSNFSINHFLGAVLSRDFGGNEINKPIYLHPTLIIARSPSSVRPAAGQPESTVKLLVMVETHPRRPQN